MPGEASGVMVSAHLTIQGNISPGAMRVHNIREEFLAEHGMAPRPILLEFLEAVKKSNVIVAHNIGFDRDVIVAACTRYGINCDPLSLHPNPLCTMLATMPILKLPFPAPKMSTKRKYNGKKEHKFPKLIEAMRYYGIDVDGNMHDARTDVKATAMLHTTMQRNKTQKDIGGAVMHAKRPKLPDSKIEFCPVMHDHPGDYMPSVDAEEHPEGTEMHAEATEA